MRRAPQTDRPLIDGPAGALEGLLERPGSGDAKAAAIVCHPHPVQGGTMQNKVTHTVARAFLAREFAVLRFNFRGVGKSTGTFDEGVGELGDAIAAARWLRGEQPNGPFWIAGFSFGAAIAIRAAVELAADGLVSVAPAVSRVAGDDGPQPDCPWLVIQGDADEVVPFDDTVAWLNALGPGPELRVFPGTGHFFHGRLVPLRESVEAFLDDHEISS